MSEKGEFGEELAVRHLERNGYRVIERNWHAGKAGEMDIIAYDGPVLAFVEVKARFNDTYGEPQSAITRHKQAQMARVAKMYLYKKELYGKVDCRFDVVAITFADNQPLIELIRDAFRLR
jgi:putative endonuclease